MSELFEAVRDKDAKAVKALLAQGVSPNGPGEPPLHRALKLKSKTIVKALLGAGADVSVVHNGFQAMHLLAQGLRDPKLGELMLAAGADIDALDEERFSGKSPLHYAVNVKKLDFAEWLVDRGANLETKCRKYGDTPLMMQLRSDSGEMNGREIAAARWLMARGADVHTVNHHGDGTLHHCAESGPKELLEELLDAGALPVRNTFGGSPLRYTMRTHGKDTELWARLLQLGCELEEVAHNETVIMSAQSSWNAVAVAFCVRKGADLTAVDNEGKNVVERARELNQPKVLKALGA